MLALRQFENHISQEYFKYVTIRQDESKRSIADVKNLKKTRALVAFYLKNFANCPDDKIKERITDGYGDKGIDGIFFNHNEKVLHIVQTKWIANGNGGLDLGDIHKVIEGVRLLIIPDLSKLNNEIKNLETEINIALLEPSVRVLISVLATTVQPVPLESKNVLDAFQTEQNTVTSYLSYEYLNLKNLHETLVNGSIESPIDAEVLLRNWNDITSPVKAIYGMINGNDLASLLEKHGKRILAPNIRYFLGKTEVNDSIIQTVQEAPENFWYFNNGITATSTSLNKRALGGSSHDNGIFDCTGFHIVNGAQTTGSLLESKKQGLNLDSVYVNMRIIEITPNLQEFGVNVTRNNNTQNRIDSRDFVSLDPVQEKLYQELLLEKIVYTYKSGDTVPDGNEGFSFEEGAIAMACSLGHVEIMVQAKREVSRLWNSTEKPPYKLLFNSGLEGPKLWRNVTVLRKVESWIRLHANRKDGRDRLILVHGNRFILMLVFILNGKFIAERQMQPNETEMNEIVYEAYEKLKNSVRTKYPTDQVASLFKNNQKCKKLKVECDI
jgi:hypothetical protein